jgi:teichuronic acid biosynthesis protein TuaE
LNNLLSKYHTWFLYIFFLTLSVIIPYYSHKYIPDDKIWLASALIIALIIGIFLLVSYVYTFWRESSFFQISLSLLLMSSFLGAGISNVKIGPLSLFPFRILLIFMFGLLLIYFIKYEDRLIINDIRIKYILLFFVFWIIYALFSINWTVSLQDAIKEFIFLFSGISLIFLVLFFYRKESHYVEFYTIWIVMAFFLILIGLWNHFAMQHLPISRINYAPDYQKAIPTAVFVNENDYASFLAISIFFFFSLVNNSKHLLYKLFGCIVIFLGLFLILETNSRANYLAVALGFIFWYIFLINLRKKIFFIVLSFLFSIPFIMVFKDKIQYVLETLSIQLTSLFVRDDMGTASVDVRENLLRNVKVFIENTFGFGVGPGNVEYYMKNFQVYETFTDFNVHNWWAEIFVHYGVVIFVFYVLMFCFLVYSLYQIRKNSHNCNVIMISEALLTSLIVFIISSISPNSFMALNYNWVLIAFAIGFVNLYQKSAIKQHQKEEK